MVRRTAPRDARKRIVTGIALSPTELRAADVRLRGADGSTWRAALEPLPADASSWPSLAFALGELSRLFGDTGGARELAVALLPPLTEVRRLELPPLKDDELHRLLVRNASRYFVNARGPQMVGAQPAASRTRGAPAPVVAAAASARLVAAVMNAAEQAGWRVRSVSPAESAWAGAALSLWPSFARQAGWVALAQPDRTDLLQLEQGRLVGVRRFRAGESDASLIAETVGSGAKLGVVGDGASWRQLGDSITKHNISIASLTKDWRDTDSINSLAAEFAGREAGPVLRSEDALSTDQARDRHTAWLVGAAAAAVLALAAGVELWGVHHQLRHVREEREQLRPQIASTLTGRTTIDATSRHLASLSTIERGSPHWSSVITELSQAITDDAYLTAIRARGDSLIVDGLAEHASRVFEALQRSKMLTDVRSAAPVRREIQDDGTALDHFTISARVVPPQSSAPITTPAVTTKPAAAARPGQ